MDCFWKVPKKYLPGKSSAFIDFYTRTMSALLIYKPNLT